MVFSLSRSSSSKDLRREYAQESQSQRPMPQVKSSSSKFNSFASALGLKSKKSPSLAIQPPPSSMSSNVVTISDATRPTSKSASSTRSRVDSIEPPTPVDSHRDNRHSLLTLADDPFAGRPMIAVPIPHLPSDPNRLSAYSNPSITDLVQKKGVDQPTFNRISYASSSSNSNNHAFDIPPMTPPLPSSSKAKTEFRELHKKRSIGSIQILRSEAPLHRQTSLVPTNSRSRAGSSSATGHDSHSMQAMDGPERPKLRARGLTDSSASHQAGFFIEERPILRKMPQKSPTLSNLPPSSEKSFQGRPTSPRVVIRQASVTHLQGPPSAPPTQRLPSPPSHVVQASSSQRHPRSSSSRHVESSSSSMSFSSAISLTNDMFANPPFADDDKRRSGRSLFSQNAYDELEISMFEHERGTVPSSPRTLKKPLSQQSLSRRVHASPPVPKTPEDASSERTFRKQRSFHHPRLPAPPVPLPPSVPVPISSGSAAVTFPSAGETTQVPTLERRRTSTASSSGRKRLFSYSSQNRPSTAQPLSSTIAADEDTFSLFSLRSEAESHILPYQAWSPSANKSSSSTSFWDESTHDHHPTSPGRPNVEYTPQAIISRSEVAKLEASVDTSPLRITRPRGFSILSASTMASEAENDSEAISISLSPPPPPPPPPPARPSNKPQPARLSTSSSKMSLSPVSGGLPTSPQSVVSGQDEQEESRSQSMPVFARNAKPSLEAISLPPPPRKQRPMLVSEHHILDKPRSRPSTQKSGPARMSAIGKAIHRRSIMRKSSFLDIDDETDRDTDHDPVDERMAGSFLDLARESFDTTRSDC